MLNNRTPEGPVGKLKIVGRAEDYDSPNEPVEAGPVGSLKVVGKASEYEEEAPSGELKILGKAEEYEKPVAPNSASASGNFLDLLRSDVVDPQTGESFGLEGFSEALYVPPGDKSGLTIGTGIDLGQWTPQSLSRAGVPQEIVEKLSPYLGKKDKSLVGKSPLTKEEIEQLDSAILEHTLGELRRDIPNFDSLPESLRLAVMAAKHQYGKGAPTLMSQAQSGDYLGAIVNLLTWTDKTKGAGDTIAKKYQALGKKLIQELTYNGG